VKVNRKNFSWCGGAKIWKYQRYIKQMEEHTYL
jgi:hypothetical protein